ncbi:hypothetical protein EJB05_42859, partial [Eragrostis curvula]
MLEPEGDNFLWKYMFSKEYLPERSAGFKLEKQMLNYTKYNRNSMPGSHQCQPMTDRDRVCGYTALL